MLNINSSQTKIAIEVESSAQPTYYSDVEMPSQQTYEKDILSQFRANISQLEDLHGRLRFVMSEVAEVIKKRS